VTPQQHLDGLLDGTSGLKVGPNSQAKGLKGGVGNQTRGLLLSQRRRSQQSRSKGGEHLKEGAWAATTVISEAPVADPSIDLLVAVGMAALQELRQAFELEAKHSRDMLVVHQTILEQRHEEESQLFERRRELIQRQEHFKDRLSDIARVAYAVAPDDPDVHQLSTRFGRAARQPEENGWHWQREVDISSLPWEAKDNAAKHDSWSQEQGTAHESWGGGGSW